MTNPIIAIIYPLIGFLFVGVIVFLLGIKKANQRIQTNQSTCQSFSKTPGMPIKNKKPKNPKYQFFRICLNLAEAEGFEPSDQLPGQQLSRLLLSTAQPRLHNTKFETPNPKSETKLKRISILISSYHCFGVLSTNFML